MTIRFDNFKGDKIEFHLVNGDKVVGIVEDADDDTVALKDVSGFEQAMQVWIVTTKIVSFTMWEKA